MLGSEFVQLVQTLKSEEGFRSKPYLDSRGILTIGYGTDLAEGITETEGEYLLRERLRSTLERLRNAWGPFSGQPVRIQSALLDAAYQMGVQGVLGFHDMLAALERGDIPAARAAALDSDWARETPNRAKRVVESFSNSESQTKKGKP